MSDLVTVLVAGIGGGSLGLEIAKALRLAARYRIAGCDISPLAFGHYCDLFDHTEVVELDNYVEQLLKICRTLRVNVIVPGGDQPTTLIAAACERFDSYGVRNASNAPRVVSLLSDKERCFDALARNGFAIPRTIALDDKFEAADVPLPCVVKPAIGSGGSAFVFFARSTEEVALYNAYLRNNGRRAIAQEYVPVSNGEFTVGVLSDLDADVRGSIVLKRVFPAKLSVAASGADFLISSGITQGHIGNYPEVARTASAIARAVGSNGPINVQGRVDTEGKFLPFEINPRFSASTYLRALAGFNEVDYFVQLLLGEQSPPLTARSGWFLRGITEVFVADEAIRA
jgi:carbamoyl-phosphate synthase large subunit